MKIARIMQAISLVLAGVLFVANVCVAQVSTSTITGSVLDASGATVPGAKVVAKNEGTGVTYETKTTSSGDYTLSALPPGFYTLTVTQQGFKIFTSVHNVLTVGAPLVVDAKLALGAVTETVQVESSYERVQTSNATIGDVVTRRQVQDLPLNGRNPLSLLTLEPGVVQRPTGGAGSGTHVFGSRDRAHNITIDGIDANESTVPNPQGNIQRVSSDSVQEFRAVTLGATAEYGRNSGANVMVATRGGTNNFHGSAFYALRHPNMNANEWFSNFQGLPRPNLRLHTGGGEIGGPIFKDKTFFFFTYQYPYLTFTQPIAFNSGIPGVYTAAMRNDGLFRFVRGTVNFNGKKYTQNSPDLADVSGNPLTGVPLCNGTTVRGNCVDSYNIFANDPAGIGGDPAVLALIRSFPLPNTASGDGFNTGGFNWNNGNKIKGPNINVRIDHNFGPNDAIFGRYLTSSRNSAADLTNGRGEIFPGAGPMGEVVRIGRNLAVGYRHVFSPSLVNELIVGFNRFGFTFTFGETQAGFGDPTKHPVWADQCIYTSFVNIATPFCNGRHTQRNITTPQFVDNLTWVHGAHTIRTGLNFRFYRHNDSRGFFGSGILVPGVLFSRSQRLAGFNNIPGAISGVSGSTPSSTDINRLQQAIDELAGIPAFFRQSYLADFVSDQYVATPYATVYTRAHQYDSYVQDEWRLRRDLNLNIGVRWEFNPPPYDDKVSLVPNKFADGSQGPVSFVRADSWYKRSNATALAPRIGLAWSPNNKTAIRVGYALLFDTISTFQVTAMAGKVPGFIQICSTQIDNNNIVSTSIGCAAPTGNTKGRISQGFPASSPPPTQKPSELLTPVAQAGSLAPASGFFDPNLKTPAVHEWSLTIQRELPGRFLSEVGYVGKRGTRLYRAYDLNQVGISQPGFLDAFKLAQQNVFKGCRPDGSGCPANVTGSTPTLLLQLTNSTLGTATSFLNSTSTIDELSRNNIGNFAVRIDNLSGANAITNRGFPANYFRPNAQFGQLFFQDSGGDSYYHGMFVAIRRRFEQGMTLGFSYTLSKSIDDMSVDPTGAVTSGNLSTTSFSQTPTDIHNFRLDRSRSDFDNRHVLLANLLYELPFGKGKKWGSGMPGWLNQIVGGWSFGGIFNYQSGEPYTLSSNSRTANGGHVSSALIRGPLDQGHLQYVTGTSACGVANSPAPCPVMYVMDTSGVITNPANPNFDCRLVTNTQTYFCIPGPGEQGSGRNLAQGTNYWNLDSSMSKKLPITERINLQFRAEFFNVLNKANFSNPRISSNGTGNIQSSAFGWTCCTTTAVPSTANVIDAGESYRVIQLNLRLAF